MKKTPFYPAGDPEAAVPLLNSCILFCDVFIVGNDSAIGLKYDEVNMFAPMIVMLEKDAAAASLLQTAENLGVPVVKNIMLAKTLSSYGKIGEAIPEASYRDASLALARTSSRKAHQRSRRFEKHGRGIHIRIPRPLSVELGASLFALTSETTASAVSGEAPASGDTVITGEKLLAESLDAIRRKLKKLLGFAVPPFHISAGSGLRNDEYRILFKGLEAGRGRLELNWYAGTDNIREAAKAASAAILRHVDGIVQRRAPELLGRDEVEAILDSAEEKYPVVTGEVKSLLPLGMIREILQSLVSEQVSIRHIAVILETLADWASFGPAPVEMIIEQLRQSLKRQICLDYTDDRQTLRVLTLEPQLEKGFADPENPLTDLKNPVTDLISSAVQRMEEKGFPPVILCSPMVRSPVKEATRRKFPNLAVLSYMEIPPDINVEPLGEIQLEGSVRSPE